MEETHAAFRKETQSQHDESMARLEERRSKQLADAEARRAKQVSDLETKRVREMELAESIITIVISSKVPEPFAAEHIVSEPFDRPTTETIKDPDCLLISCRSVTHRST